MDDFQRGLTTLATRTRGGETSAAGHLREQLEPQMFRIIRHVLRGGKGPAPLERQILAAIDAVRGCGNLSQYADIDTLARQVAQRMCDSAVRQLQSEPMAYTAEETVRF